jgi:hypothetical protein
MDKNSNDYLGWSRKSWLLANFLDNNQIKIIGFITWTLIITAFATSGIFVIFNGLEINPVPFILIASILGILSYIVFYDGLAPVPVAWILGVIIDTILLIYVLFLPEEVRVVLIALGIVTAWGLLFHSKVISAAMN